MEGRAHHLAPSLIVWAVSGDGDADCTTGCGWLRVKSIILCLHLMIERPYGFSCAFYVVLRDSGKNNIVAVAPNSIGVVGANLLGTLVLSGNTPLD